MTTTALRPYPKFKAFTPTGAALEGGKLYTYAAGTTTALATYTTGDGSTANANPVILDANGEADVWFLSQNYKLVLKDADDVTQWTVDDYAGTPYPITDEWLTYVHTWTYISATQISTTGDQTLKYPVNQAIRAVTTGGTYYGTITGSAYGSVTTLTVDFETGSFDAGVAGSSTVSVGVSAALSPALYYAQTAINAPGTSATSTTSLTIGTGSKSLTIQTDKNLVVGMSVKIAYTNTGTDWMHGDITAYTANTGALVVNVTNTNGSGTQTAWTVSLSNPVIGGAVTSSPLTMTTSRLLGRTTASTGAIEEISVSGGLSFTGGVLTGAPSIKPPMQAGRYYSNPFILTVSSATLTANRLYATGIYIGNSTTITKIGIEQATGAAGNARLGIYNMGTDGLPSSLVLDAGTVTTTSTAEKEITISQVLAAGWYYLAAVFDAGGAGASSRTIASLSPASWGIGSASTTGFPTINSITGTHTYGALPSTFTTPVIGGGAELLIWVKS